MSEELKNMPIEQLGLDNRIIQKMKTAFIYTVADLQEKTKADLSAIRSIDSYSVEKIEANLMEKIKVNLSSDIELSDKIENLGLTLRTYKALKRAGISRISELYRISELELTTIKGLGKEGLKEIQDKLTNYLGKDFDSWKDGKQSLPNSVSLGHLGIISSLFNILRSANIYTIGDIQSISDDELLAIRGIAKPSLDLLKKQLADYGVERLDEREVLQKLGLSSWAYNALKKAKINMIEELDAFSVAELMEIYNIGECYAAEIAEAYMRYNIERNGSSLSQENTGETELERLAKVKAKMEEQNKDITFKKLKLAEILEKLRNIPEYREK